MDLDQVCTLATSDYVYNRAFGEIPSFFLDKCKRSEFLDFSTSPTFLTITEIHEYLKLNVKELELKSLILCQYRYDLTETRSKVLKYKFVNNKPITLLVDYLVPGLLQKDVANPYRFEHLFDLENYTSFEIFAVKFNESDYLKKYKL